MYIKYSGTQRDIPTKWYNILADLPSTFDSFVDPNTKKVLQPSDLTHLFSENLLEQEYDKSKKYFEIPEELQEKYAIWRPTPLVRAVNLEKYLNTNCKIFYKYEGTSPIGSHKLNSGIAQAYFTKKSGFKRVVAETGAGQWGSAISLSSSIFSLDCRVYMVRNSFDSKPGRKIMMQTFGSEVTSSPSKYTKVGQEVLKQDPNFSGSLGVAIAESVEDATKNNDTAYTLGSVFNFVCLHQTIIGLELKNQLEAYDINPDIIISCIGGGSSFAGITFPFFTQKMEGKKELRFIAAESCAAPSVTRGQYAWDYGDSAKLTPLSKMYTLGYTFSPPSIHAGGLRYHGLSPLVSKFIHDGYAEGRAYSQLEIFEAASIFAKTEGIIVAPESAHGIKATIDVAREHSGENKNIIFCLTGHGNFDLAGYDLYNRGEMEDSALPEKEIRESVRELAEIDLNRGGTDQIVSSEANIPGSQSGNSFERWWDKYFENDNQSNAFGQRSKTAENIYNDTNSKILTGKMVEQELAQNSTTIKVAKDCVITPAANDLLKKNNIEIVRLS